MLEGILFENMSEGEQHSERTEDVPWIQEMYDRIWLIGVAALVFFFIMYVGWGLFDVFTTPGGPAP